MLTAVMMSRIVFITALINLVSFLLVLLSCRCVNTWKLTAWLNRYGWFKRFFKWHCFLWYIFLPSMIIHIIFAFMIAGIPF